MNRILLGATALMVAIPAMAQVAPPAVPNAPTPPRAMEVTQTRDQAVAKVRTHFATMDINRDGFVNEAEMQSMRGHHQGQRMRQMGQRRQAMRDPSQAFDRLDANRDNMISREEFARAREMREERRIAINRAPGAPGAPGMAGDHHGMGKMHRMGGKGMGGRMMRMADLDRDGRVSLQEATTSALQRFDRIDANRDGRITPDERRQQREQRKAMRAPKAG